MHGLCHESLGPKDESVHESAPESLTYQIIFTSDGVRD